MEGRQGAMGRRFVNDKSLAATERYLKIAEEAGLHPVTMATAWSKQHDFVASTKSRSEEHTSELQSLMRISYAVFCLKKKKQTEPQTHNTTTKAMKYLKKQTIQHT